MKRLLAVLLVLAMTAAAGTPARATPAEDAFLDRLVGTWRGIQAVTERSATASVELVFAWDLDHQFLRIDYTYDETAGSQRTRYLGRGYIRPYGQGTYYGCWLDSYGNASTFSGRLDGENALALDGTGFRTTYRLSRPTTLALAYAEQASDASFQAVFGATLERR